MIISEQVHVMSPPDYEDLHESLPFILNSFLILPGPNSPQRVIIFFIV
jgi:hypothetical protein